MICRCYPHLSALEVRFSRRCAIQIYVYLPYSDAQRLSVCLSVSVNDCYIVMYCCIACVSPRVASSHLTTEFGMSHMSSLFYMLRVWLAGAMTHNFWDVLRNIIFPQICRRPFPGNLSPVSTTRVDGPC